MARRSWCKIPDMDRYHFINFSKDANTYNMVHHPRKIPKHRKKGCQAPAPKSRRSAGTALIRTATSQPEIKKGPLMGTFVAAERGGLIKPVQITRPWIPTSYSLFPPTQPGSCVQQSAPEAAHGSQEPHVHSGRQSCRLQCLAAELPSVRICRTKSPDNPLSSPLIFAPRKWTGRFLPPEPARHWGLHLGDRIARRTRCPCGRSQSEAPSCPKK